MTTTLQHLHMSDLLTHDDEGVDENGPNDIEYIRMLPGQPHENFTIGDSEDMSVPPLEFTVDATRWEAPVNRLPSRHISAEKHAALNKMIDDLLDLEVIQPSGATAWSSSFGEKTFKRLRIFGRFS